MSHLPLEEAGDLTTWTLKWGLQQLYYPRENYVYNYW
jgi:hypothetical protein